MAAIKFAVLSREVFVMQVQPVEVFEFAHEDFFVPQGGIGDFRIREGECDGVVPGLFVRGGIDRDSGGFFKAHAVHVAGFNIGVDARGLRGGDGLKRDGAYSGFARDGFVVVDEEGAAAVVEQPFDGMALLQCPIRNAVSFEVICLRYVHWDEYFADVRTPTTNRRWGDG